MTSQDFPRKRGYARLFFVAALLTLLLPLQVARAAMTGWAAGVEVPADFGEEIHTGEEATAGSRRTALRSRLRLPPARIR